MNKKIILAVLAVSCTVHGGGGNPLGGLLSKTAPKTEPEQKKESVDLGKMAQEGLDKFYAGVSQQKGKVENAMREISLVMNPTNHILAWSKPIVDQNKLDPLFADIKTALAAQGRGSQVQKKLAADQLANALDRATQALAYADATVGTNVEKFKAYQADFAAIIQARNTAAERIQLFDQVLNNVKYFQEQAIIQARIAQANAQVEAAKVAAGQGSTGVNVEWMNSGFRINFWVGTKLGFVKKTFNDRRGEPIPYGLLKVNVNGKARSDDYPLQAGDFVRIWPDPTIVALDAITKFFKDLAAKAQKDLEAAVSNAVNVMAACGEVGILEARLNGFDTMVNVTADTFSKTAAVISDGLKGVADVGTIFMIKGGSFHGKLGDVTQTGVAFSVDMTVLGKSVKQNISLNPVDFADQVGNLIKDNL